MSQWSASRSQQAARVQHPQHPAQVRASHAGHGEARGPRQRGANDRAAQSTYTLARAGRQVRFGPVVFWIVVGTVVILAGWSIASATYLAFRDDVLRTLIAHQAQQQFAYEDRIAELRAQIDRTTSRQLLDQEQFERKLDELVRRQALLESHATGSGAASTRSRPARSIRRSNRSANPQPERRAAIMPNSRAPASFSTGWKPPSIGWSTGNRLR
jgi:hypothetical protein